MRLQRVGLVGRQRFFLNRYVKYLAHTSGARGNEYNSENVENKRKQRCGGKKRSRKEVEKK
jgi:hypothetical protein